MGRRRERLHLFDDRPGGGHRLSLPPDGQRRTAPNHAGLRRRRDDRRQYVVAPDPRHRTVAGRRRHRLDPRGGGSVLGIAFLAGMDVLLPHLTPELLDRGSGERGRRNTLLVLAITMHNIPEGMAVGISFALAAQADITLLPASMALALGIGIQNFPEGAAISLPLRQAGMGRARAFLMGAASGIVEPIAALLTVLAAGTVQPLMPWLLSFAAGAMLYVVVEELIPEANLRHDHETHGGTFGVMAGFLIMMILDVALG